MAVLGSVLEINEEEIHVVGKFTDTFYIIMYVMTCKMFDISKYNNTTGICLQNIRTKYPTFSWLHACFQTLFDVFGLDIFPVEISPLKTPWVKG